MRPNIGLQLLVILILTTSIFAADDPRGLKVVYGEGRTALVIGNSTYANSPLRNPANDARGVADLLRQRKFDVTEVTNGDKQKMETAIDAFGRTLKAGGVGLFYYAGHAMQINGENYLIPVGARIDKETDVKYQAVNVGQVLAELEGSGNRLNIVILDSCRDNPFARSFRSAGTGLARMDAPSGTLIAYATAPGKTAADGEGENGVYTAALLREMDTPGQELSELFKKVRASVETATAKKQTPWESTSVKGNFYFTPIDVLDQKLNLTAEQLARYKQLIKEQEESDARLNKMETEKNATIADMNRQIEDLRKKANQTGTVDGTLDQIVALGEKRKQAKADMETAQRRADDERRLREAEIAVLKGKELANRKAAFKTRYAKYQNAVALTEEGNLTATELANAWKTICNEWRVETAGDKPGELVWNNDNGVVQMASTSTFGVYPGQSSANDKSWVNSLGMEFVPVPGTDVLFCKWETRVQDFDTFVKETGRSWEKPGFQQDPTHPAVNVNWDDAQAFCKWLTAKERKAGTLQTGQTYRLPQDWEWSVAVGLNESKTGTPEEKNSKIADVYPWGNQWPPPRDAGNYDPSLNTDSFQNTSPADSFKANKHGLFDMGGNVWEWCENFYNDNSGSRVLRGGSWGGYVPRGLLSSNRNVSLPGLRFVIYGFRCVVGVSSR